MAEQQNLLRNGGFEADWSEEKNHRCIVFPAGGGVERREIGNIFVPPGWEFWFSHSPGTWDQPEGRDAHASLDSVRVQDGNKAWMFFGQWRRIRGGLMQQVDVEPGADLELSIYAHAWSSTKDDPRCSDGVGCEPVMLSESEIPEENGDPKNDAIGNIIMIVGIDPTGGTDPFSDTVVWGEPHAIYNGYVGPLTARTEAVGSRVTVFFYAIARWSFKHNDIYVDSARLVALGSSQPPPPQPAHRGAPRVQYARRYLLLPRSYGPEWGRAIAAAAHGQGLTVGYSADDAGIGDLDVREVVAVNPQDIGTGLTVGWYEEHYPGVRYTELHAGSPAEAAVMVLPPVEVGGHALSMRDPRWADTDFGEAVGGFTIGERGCLLTSLAIMLRRVYGTAVTPPLLDQLLVSERNIYQDDEDLVNWSGAISLFGAFDRSMKINQRYDEGDLQELLDDGWCVVLRVSGGAHFVVLESVEPFRVIDPWTGQRAMWNAEDVSGVRAAKLTDPFPIVPGPGPSVRGVHGAPITAPPPREDWDFWIGELRAMGVDWFKTLATDAEWIVALIEAGITPVIRLYQAHQFPGRLDRALMDAAARLIGAGARHFEIANEPNLVEVEWKPDYHGIATWQDVQWPQRVALDWWADAQELVALGGVPLFPALAPTDRNGTNERLSSVMWGQSMLVALANHCRDELAELLEQKRIGIAVHAAAFTRPFDFDPHREWGIDDMCLRGYEVVAELVWDLFRVADPLILSTEGGVYEPEHLRDMGWDPYSETEWAERTVEMFDWLERHSALTAMMPWILTDQGVSDENWRGNGWYSGKEPRIAAVRMKGSHSS